MNLKTVIKNEFKTVESDLNVNAETVQVPSKVMSKTDQSLLIKAIYAAHNGVYKMSPDMEDLVETSNNVAKVIVKDGKITVSCLTRSADEVSKMDLANTLKAVFELAGFEVKFSGSYPGWKPNPNSAILKTMTNIYEDMFGEKPGVVACHAGLECGILGTNYPEMDMISFGPTIKGAHSPDERVNIKSVQKYWKYLLRILENIPSK